MVHWAGSPAQAKAQLDWSCAYKAKAGILQKETVWVNTAKMHLEVWYEIYVKPWHPWPRAGNGGNVCYLSSYFCVLL